MQDITAAIKKMCIKKEMVYAEQASTVQQDQAVQQIVQQDTIVVILPMCIQQEMDNVMGDTIVRLDQQVLHKVHVETVIIALQEQQRLLHV